MVMENQPTVMENRPMVMENNHTHTPIVEESALELALELADSSSESANSDADSPKIGVWVQALRLVYFHCFTWE